MSSLSNSDHVGISSVSYQFLSKVADHYEMPHFQCNSGSRI